MTEARFIIEPTDESVGYCACCGNTTRRIWGWLQQHDENAALYYVTWTIGRMTDGARVQMIIGPWGDQTSANDRNAIFIDYFADEPPGTFTIIDADESLTDVAKHSLRRVDVIGTPLAQLCFDLLDSIWLQDTRMQEVWDWV